MSSDEFEPELVTRYRVLPRDDFDASLAKRELACSPHAWEKKDGGRYDPHNHVFVFASADDAIGYACQRTDIPDAIVVAVSVKPSMLSADESAIREVDPAEEIRARLIEEGSTEFLQELTAGGKFDGLPNYWRSSEVHAGPIALDDTASIVFVRDSSTSQGKQ